MRLLQKVLTRFNGLHYRQEYLCLAGNDHSDTLQVYILSDGKPIKDITKLHCFVGYNPVVFAISSHDLSTSANENLQLVFTKWHIDQNAVFSKKDAIAMLHLKKIPSTQDESSVLFYEGVLGEHHFIPGFYQQVIALNNHIIGKRPGNVYLEGNLYKQVQIAYSIPRKISLITTGNDQVFNLFPTDLHGKSGDQYIISLRHEGKACRQVMENKTLVLSDVAPESYKNVYALGSNHMKEMKERSSFDFDAGNSIHFNLPLPKHLVAYRELKLTGSFIHGIHRILQFSIVHEQKNVDRLPVLKHVHNCLATWQFRSGRPGNYLLR